MKVIALISMGLVLANAQVLTQEPSTGVVMAGDSGATLSCSYNNTESDDTIQWFREDENGDEVQMGDELISVDDDGVTSTLTLVEDFKMGKYVCKVDEERLDFDVQFTFKLEKMLKSYNVMQGDDLKLFCKLRKGSISDGNPQFKWYIKPGSVDDPTTVEGDELMPNKTEVGDIEPHIKIINLVDQSVVKIEDAVYTDRSWYKCVVTNDFGQEASVETLVRVRDRYGALYPFVGIVVEVLVLCIVIFLCERRRSKNEVDEEEEYQGGGAMGSGNNSNLRRRN